MVQSPGERLRRKKARNKRWYLKNRNRLLEEGRAYVKKNGKNDNSVYARYKFQAKKRGIKLFLTLEEFSNIRKMPCFYCGKEGPSGIDRLNNEKFYKKSNSVPCCSTHNSMKSTMRYEKFITECEKIVKY